MSDLKITVAARRTFLRFVAERERIRLAKENGEPGPLTRDPILRKFRFCNVRRKDDRVSRWIIQRIITPGREDPNLFIQLAFARYINWPDTITQLMEMNLWPRGSETPKWKAIGDAIDERVKRGAQAWTGAYMIRAESSPEAPWYEYGKGRYVSEVAIGSLWEPAARADILAGIKAKSLSATHAAIVAHGYGFGSFMAGQVVADYSYADRLLGGASDRYTWAPLGPGSTRGLNRLVRPKEDIRKPWAVPEAIRLMRELLTATYDHDVMFGDLTLHDVQNCLCELDKYLRVKNGEGRPRSLYTPTKEAML